jgi:hypothetical protein
LTILETVLIYVGIPALVIALVFGLVFAGSARRGGSKRYRPGRPFEFRPVWFLSSPEQVKGDGAGERHALAADQAKPALPAGGSRTAGTHPSPWPASDQARQSVTGGASDRW